MLALVNADACAIPAQYVLRSSGMLGEQAEADKQVGLAAAHRLLEVEDRLRRSSRLSIRDVGVYLSTLA